MYRWMVFLHVFAGMSFMLAHGGATAMALLLKKERDPARMQTLLDVSSYSWPMFALTLLLLLASGITAGVMGRWWSQGWIWTALVILIAMSAYMGWASRAQYHKLRKVLGMPYFEGSGDQPALPPAPLEEIHQVQARLQPGRLAAIGLGSVAVILVLMMYKPF